MKTVTKITCTNKDRWWNNPAFILCACIAIVTVGVFFVAYFNGVQP